MRSSLPLLRRGRINLNDNTTASAAAGLDVRIAQELVEQARSEGLSLTGADGGDPPRDRGGLGSGDDRTPRPCQRRPRRRCPRSRTVPPQYRADRYRAGRGRGAAGSRQFEPQIVPKHARRITGFDEAVVSIYTKGLTTGEIRDHLAEIYGAEVSRETISKITDAVAAELAEWQSRSLDRVYAVVMIDCTWVKIRDGQVTSRPSTSRSVSASTEPMTLTEEAKYRRGRRSDPHRNRVHHPARPHWTCQHGLAFGVRPGRFGRVLKHHSRRGPRDQVVATASDLRHPGLLKVRDREI